MDNRAGTIITAALQLPPIIHPEQLDTRQRDRPLPLEPFAPREPYVAQAAHYQQDSHQQQQQPPPPPQQQQHQAQQQYQVAPISSTPQHQQPPSLPTPVASLVSQLGIHDSKHPHIASPGPRKSLEAATTPRTSLVHVPGGNLSVNVSKFTIPSAHSQDARSTLLLLSEKAEGRLTPPLLMTSSQHSNTSILSLSTQSGGGGLLNTPGRPYPPILPWAADLDDEHDPLPELKSQMASPPPVQNGGGSPANRQVQKARRKWSDQETKDLLMGCSIHGVGNWKKMLEDPRFTFNNRSSVDLKDRFRTCFPKEYSRHISGKKPKGAPPVSKTSDLAILLVTGDEETGNLKRPDNGQGTRGRSKKKCSESTIPDVAERLGFPKCFPKAPRRERKPFSPDEDAALMQGFKVYGPLWSKIQGDPELNLQHRRGTDLRDRFRNAFPDKYAQAGFKSKPKHPPKPPRSSPSNRDENNNSEIIDNTDRSISVPPSMDSRHHYDAHTDSSPLDDFALTTSSHIDDHGDDPRKDDFGVSMMQEFLGANSVRDWESNDPISGDSDHVFSHTATDVRSTSAPVVVPTTSMSVEATLAVDFGGGSLAHFDQQDLFHSPVVSGKNDAHDLVRWEDMVTHPIFTLDAPPNGVGGVGGVGMGMDESVTLAPINPALFGGSSSSSSSNGPLSLGGPQSESVVSGVPGLAALLEEVANGPICDAIGVGKHAKKRTKKRRKGRREEGMNDEGSGAGEEDSCGGGNEEGPQSSKKRRGAEKKGLEKDMPGGPVGA